MASQSRFDISKSSARSTEALTRAIAALQTLRMQGVDAGIVGALADNPVLHHERIDVAVLDRGPLTFNDVLRVVEEAVQPFDYDVVFLDRGKSAVCAPYLGELRREAELLDHTRAA
jgi:hypothetical protein